MNPEPVYIHLRVRTSQPSADSDPSVRPADADTRWSGRWLDRRVSSGGHGGVRRAGGFTGVDAFLNASMLLGGMGPVGELPNDESKIFAGVYALYSGLVFIVSAGVLLAPVVHRILHKLHADRA